MEELEPRTGSTLREHQPVPYNLLPKLKLLGRCRVQSLLHQLKLQSGRARRCRGLRIRMKLCPQNWVCDSSRAPAARSRGIRFYKGVNNTGTHTGHLWSNTGTLLASATFTGETATGWQQVNFSTPVAITANTVYVASYFSPTGDFAVDRSYFATAGVSNPPLSAPMDGGAGAANGIYITGARASSLQPLTKARTTGSMSCTAAP